MVAQKVVVYWFRRDLRLNDNHGLYQALETGLPVLPLFIFDSAILEELPSDDKRVSLIYDQLIEMNKQLAKFDSSLLIKNGLPIDIFQRLTKEFQIQAVYTNEDYEPYARSRDKEVNDFLTQLGIEFKVFQDQVVVHPEVVKKKDGDPYTIYTPWSKVWKQKFDPNKTENFPSEKKLRNLTNNLFKFPSIEAIGFAKQKVVVNKEIPNDTLLSDYAELRDFPGRKGTSGLSTALRFGMISIRQLIKTSANYPVFINELGWREFYMMILYFYPKVVTQSFKSKYDKIKWRNNEEEFELWKKGETGYPIVDAGMRQLIQTGYMHNRVRMIVASFLTKHLLIDWRWGENWFAEKLLDYELASNNGGWQWAAGTGCDAAPYFRIFNPTTQTQKFDSNFDYVKQWVPEFDSDNYVQPIVDQKYARERALVTYKDAL